MYGMVGFVLTHSKVGEYFHLWNGAARRSVLRIHPFRRSQGGHRSTSTLERPSVESRGLVAFCHRATYHCFPPATTINTLRRRLVFLQLPDVAGQRERER